MRYLLLALLFAGCSTTEKGPGIYTINASLSAYTNAYLEYKQIYLGRGYADYHIEVVFGDTNFPTVGQCYRPSDSYIRDVIINPAYWARVGDEDKLELIFHEMGHCDLNYQHQEHTDGIMNSRLRHDYLTDSLIQNFFLEGL